MSWSTSGYEIHTMNMVWRLIQCFKFYHSCFVAIIAGDLPPPSNVDGSSFRIYYMPKACLDYHHLVGIYNSDSLTTAFCMLYIWILRKTFPIQLSYFLYLLLVLFDWDLSEPFRLVFLRNGNYDISLPANFVFENIRPWTFVSHNLEF